MKLNKVKIASFLDKARTLINEKDLSIKQIFNYTFIKNKKGVVFEYFDKDGKYCKTPYSHVNKIVERYASIINKKLNGENKHSIVMLKIGNSPEWCEIFYSLLMAGYKPLLINAKTSIDGVNNLAKQAKAIAIIADDKNNYEIKKILVNEILADDANDDFKADWEDEVIFCSSGTTGDVKMMVFNGYNLCHQIASSLEMAKTTTDIMYPNKYGKIKILGMIPFHHIFGFVAVFLWYTFYGKTIVFPSSINSKDILELCSKHKISHVYSVPLFWDSLALQYNRQKEISEEPTKGYLNALLAMNLEGGKKLKGVVVKKIQQNLLGSNIRMCISGGGYLSENTSRTINGMGYPLYNGFGMTEIGVTSVELSPDLNTRLECAVGKPFYGVSYKFGDDNELLVKSEAIHSREIIGGVEQKANLDEDGYFHTGDIGAINGDGNYFIKGRIKDVIISANGENIFPDELELYFKNISDIQNFTILGIKPNKKGHDIVALVVQIKTDSVDTYESILREIKADSKHLPNGARIDKVYFTTKPLPTANNMKVKRHIIKNEIEKGSEDFFSYEGKAVGKEVVNFDQETIVNILIPVKKIFAEVLSLKEEDISNDAHWIKDLGGDSMNFVDMILKVYDKFDITIPDEKFAELTCVNDIVKIILEIKK